MDAISDEDFDRLWKEAVAEAAAAEKSKKQRKSRSKSHIYAPSKTKRSYKKYYSSLDERGEKPIGDELLPQSLSVSTRNDFEQSSQRSDDGHDRRRSSTPASIDNELNCRPTDPLPKVPSVPAISSSAHELTRRSSLGSEPNSFKSNHNLDRRSASSKSSSDDGFTPRRISSISKVPSLPCISDTTMYGREDLTALYYVDSLKPASFHKYQLDEASVNSLVSGFSAYESVSDTRWKQQGLTRSNSRSPTRGAKEQNNIEGGQQSSRRLSSEPSLSPEAVKHILEAESSKQQRLLFHIPTTFEVKGYKKNRNQSTGLVLSFGQENDTGTVMVKGISSTSLFAETQLKRGDEILMINSHRIKSPNQAAKIMKSLSGDVTIYASAGSRAPGMKYVRVKAGGKSKKNVHTEDIDSSIHSAVKDANFVTQSNGLVRVAHVDPGGIFGKTLSVGDVVITVNGALVQNDEEAKKLLLDTRHGVICILIYSMSNLCKGLIDQLLPGWKSSKASEVEVTLSRDDVSFSVVWGDDWVCECKRCDEEVVYISDIQPAIQKINVATSFVMGRIIEASGGQRKQIALDADCITRTAATTDPTTEGITDDENEAGLQSEESQQLDPSMLKSTPIQTLQESSNKRLSLQKGKSLYLELHCKDDESSVEEC